jgi:hypothetical protein
VRMHWCTWQTTNNARNNTNQIKINITKVNTKKCFLLLSKEKNT